MKKITFIGGGSAKFVCKLVGDFFSFKELQDVEICLMDIDPGRLEQARAVVSKAIEESHVPARVSKTIAQRRALDGADYVIVTIMVGGFKHYKSDGEIPAKYGVSIAIGDTIGPGGVFRLIRTAPVLEKIVRNLREVAPNAMVLNYSNPMSMNVWAMLNYGHQRTIGLCHSIQGRIYLLEEFFHLPHGSIHYKAGGINHVNYYLSLEYQGRDFYPCLLRNRKKLLKNDPGTWNVFFELIEHLGFLPAECADHQSEYYPWFRKSRRMLNHYQVGHMRGYRNDKKNSALHRRITEDILAGKAAIERERSLEYGAYIIHALESGAPMLFYGNVRNNGLIENLPPDAVVEVPCHADCHGIFAGQVGPIPTQLAAVMTPHVNIHRLAIQSVMEKDRRKVRQAIQLDPLTGAILTLPQISRMVDEMMEANREYMKEWP